MTGPGRRALMASILAAPAAGASAQQPRMDRLRISVALNRFDQFLPLLRQFAAAAPDLTPEIVILDDNEGLFGGRSHGPTDERPGGPDVTLVDVFDLAWGETRGLWRPLPAAFHDAGRASAGALEHLMYPLAGEDAMLVSATPGGPVLLHRQSVLPNPPRDAVALLDYARENPGRFFYPRPSESVGGRLFLMILPHLLGDRDPSDPQTGWSKSWEWLEELGRYVSYYPSHDDAAFEELAAADVHLFPAPLASYLRARLDGVAEEDTRFLCLGEGGMIPQALFIAVPRLAPIEKLPLVERFARFLLRPETQSRFFGRNILPGESVFGLSEATPRTPEERAALHDILPAAEAQRIVAAPRHPRLRPHHLRYLLQTWEERIGARHGERR